MLTSKSKLRVFLCHATQDKPIVNGLCRWLGTEDWIDPWMNDEKLLPGQNRELETENAIENAHAVIVCISKKSVSEEGYVQRELNSVLEVALQKPPGKVFVIPTRLDNVEIPRKLRHLHYVDYFPVENVEKAQKLLILSLRGRAQELDILSESKEMDVEFPYVSLEPSVQLPAKLNSNITENLLEFGDENMKIQSGTFHAGRNEPKWQLLEGEGERYFKKRIKFPNPFDEPPAVVVNLSGLDVDKSENLRVRIEASDIDRNGFYLTFVTWSETHIYGLWTQWVAYGN